MSLLVMIDTHLSVSLLMHLTLTAFHVTRDLWDGTSENCYLAGVQPLEVAIASIIPQYLCVLPILGCGVNLLRGIYDQIGFVAVCLTISGVLLQAFRGISIGILISAICVFHRYNTYMHPVCDPAFVLTASAFATGM